MWLSSHPSTNRFVLTQNWSLLWSKSALWKAGFGRHMLKNGTKLGKNARFPSVQEKRMKRSPHSASPRNRSKDLRKSQKTNHRSIHINKTKKNKLVTGKTGTYPVKGSKN